MINTDLENEFLSSEFDVDGMSFPFAQVINEKKKSECGFFISLENLIAAEWKELESIEVHTTTWSTGNETDGILIQKPRLIVLHQTPLLMFERQTGLLIGTYNARTYLSQKSALILKTKYLVYFVDSSNSLLHELPLQLTMKGSAGASFGEHLRGFRAELERAFAQTYKQPLKRKGEKFHALGAFQITTEPQLKGEGQQSNWVCTTVAHERPTAENWLNYFVGFTSLKDRLLFDVDQYAEFCKVEEVTNEIALHSIAENRDIDTDTARKSSFPPEPTSIETLQPVPKSQSNGMVSPVVASAASKATNDKDDIIPF